MAAQGRKNVHGKAGVRFKAGYTKSKHENKLRTLVTDLVKYERVTVTSGMVKDLRSLAEHMITLGKRGDLINGKVVYTQTNCGNKTIVQVSDFASGTY